MGPDQRPFQKGRLPLIAFHVQDALRNAVGFASFNKIY
jgi:hypothetical protein